MSSTQPHPPTAPKQQTHADVPFLAIFLGVGSLFFFMIAANTPEAAMQFHALVFMGAFLAGMYALLMHLQMGKAIDPNAYNMNIVKTGVFASAFWGVAGFLVGVIIALQLSFPNLLYFENLPWTNFSRLRPLHTSAVIFAFGGTVLLTTSFYVVQRTTRARLLPGAARRRPCAVVRLLGISALHRYRGDRVPHGHHPVQGVCRA